jgi:hypothetical protein
MGPLYPFLYLYSFKTDAVSIAVVLSCGLPPVAISNPNADDRLRLSMLLWALTGSSSCSNLHSRPEMDAPYRDVEGPWRLIKEVGSGGTSFTSPDT